MSSIRQATEDHKDDKNDNRKDAPLWLLMYWIFPVLFFAIFARSTVTFHIHPIPTHPGPSVFPKQRPPGWKRTSMLPLEQQQGKQAPAPPQALLSQEALGLSQQIERLKQSYSNHPDNIQNAMEYLQAMQFYEQHFSSSQYAQPLMRLYETLQEKVKQALALSTTPMLLQLLCQLYVEQGQFLFRQSYHVDKAMARWNACLQIDPTAAQAWRARGDAWRTMGSEYRDKAIHDYMQVLQHSQQESSSSSSSFVLLQLAQLLKMNAAEWKTVVIKAEEYLSDLSIQTPPNSLPAKYQHFTAIYRLHFSLMWYFLLHANVPRAREHLHTGCLAKVAGLPSWQAGAELQKVHNTRSIFRKGFWSRQMGSSTKTPIFVMGFIQSGTQLVEQHLLEAHPDIVAASPSVWNQRLTEIRNQIASVSPADLPAVVHSLAEIIVQQMLDSRSAHFAVDSYWMNYYSIGLLHTIFPEALIVHVVRDPLENLVAAMMHDSSSSLSEFGVHDYACDWNVLVELYRAYREMMRHWEEVLPGRITHVRYEDWIADPTGMASALLERIHLTSDRSLVIPHHEAAVHAFRPYEEEFDRISKSLTDLGVYNVPFTLKSPRLQEQAHLDREEHEEL